MDAALGRFLTWVRPRTRPANLVAYEDAVVALDDYLRRRRRAAAALTPRDVRTFLTTGGPRWPDAPTSARRFCAALRVVVGWLVRDVGAPRAPEIIAVAAKESRVTARAARVTTILSRSEAPSPTDTDEPALDGYWIVVLRSETHAVVRALGTRRLVGPVLLPADVLRLLPAGAAINMRLVRVARTWRVLEHGPCYPAAALPALRQSLRVVRA